MEQIKIVNKIAKKPKYKLKIIFFFQDFKLQKFFFPNLKKSDNQLIFKNYVFNFNNIKVAKYYYKNQFQKMKTAEVNLLLVVQTFVFVKMEQNIFIY